MKNGFAWVLGGSFGVLFYGAQIVVSILQIMATYQGFHSYLAWSVGAAVIATFFLGPYPIIGTFFGIMGAITAWHWTWWQSTLLFTWHFILLLVIVGVVSLFRGNRAD
jgi:hypothetical protein